MPFSILHLSDLHRDLANEVPNDWLLESLERDIAQYPLAQPAILFPSLCVVSGDLVYGVKPGSPDATKELERQYAQAEEFLVELARRFFGNDRNRVIIIPGNHDVCYADVMNSMERIDIPSDEAARKSLVKELFSKGTRLRWSWNDLCFFRISKNDRYDERLAAFSAMYERFYEGSRVFPLDPSRQHAVFDFPDLRFCVIALSSCHNNDPLKRAGRFHHSALVNAGKAIRESHRMGWLVAAAWHHNLVGGPSQDDYLESESLQILIDSGVSLGFHGHQHLAECVDERYRMGKGGRKITTVSAGTLCAAEHYLPPGFPRGFNVVEIDVDSLCCRVHQRQMVNRTFETPVWGPGRFFESDRSYLDVELCRPLAARPPGLDQRMVLEEAEHLIGLGRFKEAKERLATIRENPLARPLMLTALENLQDFRALTDDMWPPQSIREAVAIGGVILENGTREQAQKFVEAQFVKECEDASVKEVVLRIHKRRLQ